MEQSHCAELEEATHTEVRPLSPPQVESFGVVFFPPGVLRDPRSEEEREMHFLSGDSGRPDPES